MTDKVSGDTDTRSRETDTLSWLPPRRAIAESCLADEARLVGAFIESAHFNAEEHRRIETLARRLAHAVRAGRRRFGGIDALMHEYGLTSEEGVILMCLAEALLRVPDAETADRLIAEKIAEGDWERHLGASDSLFVNASTWGLMLTGRVVSMGQAESAGAGSLVKRLVARSGEPVIRETMRRAVRILADQFIFGRSIAAALTRAKDLETRGYLLSYDMLGEAARTSRDAERYFARYMAAVRAVGAAAGEPEGGFLALMARPGISVKLSALHPRFEPAKAPLVRREVGARVLELARAARDAGLSLTIDTEEQDRLDLTLQIFADVLADPSLGDWHGLGLAVQAYGKRAMPVLKWLAALAHQSQRRIPLRLVKGAYWDSEIKAAQMAALADYPVFTRKVNTDVSYLACTRYILSKPDHFYPQFATHNAHTVAAIATLAGKRPYEFQRLHGMGQALYEEVVGPDGLGRACRIYAPVGGHEDLLSYLVRRLLENGANTSFMRRLADDEAPMASIIRDPFDRAETTGPGPNAKIPRPPDLFWPERHNSLGIALWESEQRRPLLDAIQSALSLPVAAGPIVSGEADTGEPDWPVHSPHDRRVTVGSCVTAGEEHIEAALEAACGAAQDWDRLGGVARAEILERAAGLLERDRAQLMGVMVREAGKTLENALSDVREAADFLRYYAAEARRLFADPMVLAGPTGEENRLSLHGRGVFACISPWNFPLAIFTGQVAAALAAGNAVLAKPAEQTPLTGYLAARLLHVAGVPAEVLHFLPGPGETVGARLVADPRIAGVAFTGGNDTAAIIARALAAREGPIVPFIAETGGINAMIVDSSALPEHAVRDAVRSAFDSAGQRCSALRILFLQEDVANTILTMLTGAMETLTVGDPMDYGTDIGPVIDLAAENALKAHKHRMEREARLLIDLPLPYDCQQGSYVTPAAYEIGSTAMLEREVFGPVLHVVRYARDRLGEVCEAINATGYGLTLGLHSRIRATVDFVVSHVRVGNTYVNRDQIGAVVGVQPFGGEGLSGTGPKMGGPFTLPRFAVERTRTTDITATGGNVALLSLTSGVDEEEDDGAGRM